MLSPMETLYTYFPVTFFLRIAFLLFVDVAVGILLYKQYKKNKIEKKKAIAIEVLVVYITFVLFLAVLSRRSLDYYRFGMGAVDYYFLLFSCSSEVDLTEFILNIAVFVPVGVLACMVFAKQKLIKAVFVGFCLSSVIELSQLVLKCGYTSGVDIIHNTLGTLVGALLSLLVISVAKKIKMSKKDG